MRCINTILCATVLWFACTGVFAQESATTDLLAHFPVAVVSQDAATLDVIPVDANEFFAGGWYQAGTPKEDGRIYRWMGPRAGALDFALAAQRELALEIGLAVPRAAGVPAFTVRFYWNGEFIGGALLDKQAQIVKMTVPANLTRVGQNRLEIIPSFWVNASKLAGGTSNSNVSVNLYHLKFARDTKASTPKAAPKRTSDNGIEQPSNTVITLYETIPATARLTIAGKWDGAAPSAEALVMVRTQSGETKQVARFAADATQPSIDFEFPNATDAELTFAEISLVVRQSDEAATAAKFEWTQLSLSAPEPKIRLNPVRSRQPSPRPNIILYVIDTLRASHLEPYGATNVKTPNFTALARQGVMFSEALAHTSWTRPSVVTMLTSQYETTHGTTTMEHMLSKAVPYLPEILRTNGYHTAAVSMNGHVAPQWGFGRGFDSFATLNAERSELLTPPEPRAYVDKLWDKYIAPGIKRDTEPFFLYLHELDPHGPYTPPAPFDAMYPTHYRGQPDVEADHIGLVRTHLTELDPQDIAYLETRYRGEVSFVDAVLGAFRDRLQQEGLDDTILIVVSDHGEEFGEHGGIGHSVTLYEEMLRVPMFWLWRGPLAEGRRVDVPIGLVDLAPTLLGLLEIAPPNEMRGRNMVAYVDGRHTTAAPRPMYSYKSDQPGRALQAIHYGPWKLIERMWGPMSTFELYDLSDDAGEITNRWIGEPVIGGALRQSMAWERHTAGPSAPTEQNKLETLDPETIEQLRNLGYVQ